MHILTERPNGKLACVFENTAEKLNWNKINPITTDIFELKFNDNAYDIEYVIEGGVVKNMMINPENELFTIYVDSFQEGNLKMQLSYEFLDELKSTRDQIFLLRSNGESTSWTALPGKDPNKIEFMIYFKQGNTVIEFQKDEIILK